MPIEIIVKGDSEASTLASVLFASAALCKNHKGNCSTCPGHTEIKSNGIPSYICRLGLYAEREAQKIKDGKVITEEDMANLDVHARNYTGRETGFVYEDVAFNLLLRSKSTQ